MCCFPVGRGCLVVPLCLLSPEGAPLRYCQTAAQIPSFVRSVSMGSVDIFLSILYQQECGSPSRVVQCDVPQPCAVVEVWSLSSTARLTALSAVVNKAYQVRSSGNALLPSKMQIRVCFNVKYLRNRAEEGKMKLLKVGSERSGC